MTEHLTVFLGREHLGRITLGGKDDRYHLEYAPSWLTGPGYAVSPHPFAWCLARS